MSSIFKTIRSYLKNSAFARNLLITLSGSSLSFLAQLVLTPIITRLYTPEAYGYFAVFNSSVLNIAKLLSLSLPMGIVVVKRHEVNRLSSLSFFVSTVLFFVCQVLFIIFGGWFERQFNIEGMGIFTYLIPVTAYLMSFNGIIVNLNIRHKRFKVNSVAEASKSWSSRAILLGLGVMQVFQQSGIIISEIIGKIINSVLIFRPARLKERLGQAKNYSATILKNSWKKFRSYPFLIYPAAQLNLLSNSLPIFLFSLYTSQDIVGSYTLVVSLLDIPVRIFGNSILPVITQRSAEDMLNAKKLGNFPIKILVQLCLLSFLIYGVVFFAGEWAFPFILGDQWELAGEFAKYMALYYFFRLVNVPLSGLYNATRQEKRFLTLNVIKFAIRTAFIPCFYFVEDPVRLIFILSILNLLAELVNLQSVWLLSKKFSN